MDSQHAVLLVGVSGPSSSGKTTLSRLLRSVIPGAFVLHEDDFYKPDAEIPFTDGLQDWDCLEAINLPGLSAALHHIKVRGAPPPELVSKEDRNSVQGTSVHDEVVQACRESMCALLQGAESGRECIVAIIDGFLLFSEGMREVRDAFDVKLFLRTGYETAKRRREARNGYVTLGGFWEDPPGYVDAIVWPNYVKDHAFLFQNGDVEAGFNEEVCQNLNITPMPDGDDQDMSKCLTWACSTIEAAIIHKLAELQSST